VDVTMWRADDARAAESPRQFGVNREEILTHAVDSAL
jgi:hypothetical protein